MHAQDHNDRHLPGGVDALDIPTLLATVGGNGLTITNGVLQVNVDGTTIEISADSLRVKDLGISTAKLADNSVTTAKITDANVTPEKLTGFREYVLQNYSFASTSSYTFSIPSTVRSIRLHIFGRLVTASAVGLRFNGDSGTNYYWTSIRSRYAAGAPTTYSENTNRIVLGIFGGVSDRNGEIHATIPYVQGATAHIVYAQGGHLSSTVDATFNLNQGSWETAAAITSMTVFNDAASNFVSGGLEVWATGT
jgi:hypothetical protein